MEPWSLALGAGAFTLAGVVAGIFTGLAPGVHVNNVATVLVAGRTAVTGLIASVLAWADPTAWEALAILSCFIVGNLVSHSFLDFVPSVFLGAPEEKTALSVLPGHRLLLEGRGFEAVWLSARGSLLGTLLAVALLLPLRFVMGDPIEGYARIEPYIAIVLIALVAALVLSERETRAANGHRISGAWAQRARALLLFLAAGLLGTVALDTDLFSRWNWLPLGPLLDDFGTLVLFPLFSGLFGISTLLLSLERDLVVPHQREDTDGARVRWGRGVACGGLAGAAVSWFPGLSSGAATVLAQWVAGRGHRDERDANREFIVALGGVGTATSVLTVAALFIIGRARSGAAAAIRALVPPDALGWPDPLDLPGLLLILCGAALLAAAVSYPLTLCIARRFARWIGRVPYDRVARIVLVGLGALLFVLAGIMGVLLAAVATVLGLLPPRIGVKRIHLMGCLLLPVILLYLGR